jgi:hypothetical protein
MNEIKDRALNIGLDEDVAMMEVVRDILRSAHSLPTQISAANAVKRSILSIDRGATEMKLEVLRLRWARLLLTL